MWYSNDILFSRKCNKLMVLCLIYIYWGYHPNLKELIISSFCILYAYICNKIYINIYTHHERYTCIIIKVYTKYEQCDFKFMK